MGLGGWKLTQGMVMRGHILILALALVCVLLPWCALRGGENKQQVDFHTSDRCMACHNQLVTSKGQDVSIGIDWRSSIMANSSRDPYWQASIRRETIDHPSVTRDVQDECSVCHMPITRYEAKEHNQKGEVFAFLPFPGKERRGCEG